MERKKIKTKTIRVPISAKFKSSGEVIFTYEEMPLDTYEAWLKKCYELGS
jgi:hypothetical protein